MSKRFKLYAVISENAGHRSCLNTYDNMLYQLRGKEVKIETKYLFLNQLNTYPIKGISKNGLRLQFKDIKSLRIENRTFKTIRQRIKKFYKESWDTELKEIQFSGWKRLLNIKE